MNRWGFLLCCVAGWVNRHQQDVFDHLQEEVRVLKGQRRGRWLQFDICRCFRLAAQGVQLTVQLASGRNDRFGADFRTIARDRVHRARYGAGSGGGLVPGSQIPPGNSDDTIERSEFMAVPVPTIRDENANGMLDVLEPEQAFNTSFTNNPGVLTVHWPVIPGRVNQVFFCDEPGKPFQPLSNVITAGQGEIELSHTNEPSADISQRLYRVRAL